jgi:hypothetical protein
VVDAKGDLIVGTGADAASRLAVSDNGSTLVANSAAATGLSYKEDYAAGKNKVINGDFAVNQRNFTSTTSSNTYIFDRWVTLNSGGTSTYSLETFTLGEAPVAGYESKNFVRIVSTGQSAAAHNTRLVNRMESVRTFANETVTVSFWAKASTGTPLVAVYFQQNYGTGGSPSSSVNLNGQKIAITTSWARYSFTFAIPSISGKTLGSNNNDFLSVFLTTSAGSDFNDRTDSLGFQSATIDFWGVQVEAGSVATAFQTATGTLQGELAACMRYCEKIELADGVPLVTGQAYSTTAAWAGISWTTQKRTTPTITQTGTIQALQSNTGTSGTTFAYTTLSKNYARMEHSGGSGLVAGNASLFQATSGAASLLITAEL